MKYLLILIVIAFAFLPNIYPHINFIPFEINGFPVDQLSHIKDNTFYISTNSYLLKTNDYFHTYDTLYHYSSGGISFFVDTAYKPADRIIVRGTDVLNPQFITLDGGKNWNPFNSNNKEYSFSKNNIYTCDNKSLVQSSDNGNTWFTLPGLNLNIQEGYTQPLADAYNNIYITVAYGESYGTVYWTSYTFYRSTDNGISWQKKIETGVHTIQYWRMGKSLNYFGVYTVSPTPSTKFYNSKLDTVITVNKGGDYPIIDNLGNIYLYYGDVPPELRYLDYSSNWGSTWTHSTGNIPWYIEDMLIDDYGFLYVKAYGYMKLQKSLYKYLSSDSISFGRTSIANTLYKKITVYNPLNRALSLDSLVFNNPSFMVNNFTKSSIQPFGSTSFDIGFTPQNGDSLNTTAVLYLEKLELQIKLNGKGTTTDIKDITNEFKYDLSQNYPNPFNPTTTIHYSIAKEGCTKITLFDIIGNKVAVLVDENKPAGSYDVQINISSLPSGIYFYKLESAQFSQTKKMMLIK